MRNVVIDSRGKRKAETGATGHGGEEEERKKREKRESGRLEEGKKKRKIEVL